ncbi:hypothetical protein JCM11251_003420 [Rhodosporidiobolus azoricus]
MSTSLAPPHPSKPSKSDIRKTRWTQEEISELFAIGEAVLVAGQPDNFDEVRRRMKTDARYRSVTAIRAKYTTLMKERSKKQKAKGEQAEEDLKVEPDSAIPLGQHVEEPPKLRQTSQAVDELLHTLQADPLIAPPPADQQPLSSPWTLAEDAALSVTLATLPFNKPDMQGLYRLVVTNYEREEGLPWTKSEEELLARWKVVIFRFHTAFGGNPAMELALNKISDDLSILLAEVAASLRNPSAAASPLSSLSSASVTTGATQPSTQAAVPSVFPSTGPSQRCAGSGLPAIIPSPLQQRRSSIAEAPGPGLATWQTLSQQRIPTPFQAGPPLAATGLARTVSSPLPQSTLRPSNSPTKLLISPNTPATQAGPPFPNQQISASLTNPLPTGPDRRAETLSVDTNHPTSHPLHSQPHPHVHFAPDPVGLPAFDPQFPSPAKPPGPQGYTSSSTEALEQLNRYRAEWSGRGLDDLGDKGGAPGAKSFQSAGGSSGMESCASKGEGNYPFRVEDRISSSTFPPHSPPVEKADLEVVDFAEPDGGWSLSYSSLPGAYPMDATTSYGHPAASAGPSFSPHPSYLPPPVGISFAPSAGSPAPGKSVPRRSKNRPTVKVELDFPPNPPTRRTSTRKRSREISYAEAEATSGSSSSREGSVSVGKDVKVEGGDRGHMKNRKGKGLPVSVSGKKGKKPKKDASAEEWREEDAEGEDDDVIVEEPRIKARGRGGSLNA